MNQKYLQLFVRLSVGTGFLSAVADRFGFWGEPGSPNASWGNWENFVLYSNKINFFVSADMGEFLAIVATVLEVVLALMLIIGYKTRIAAISSGVLLTFFAVAMTIAFGIKPTLSYSVWIDASACFLLATVNNFDFSVDKSIN